MPAQQAQPVGILARDFEPDKVAPPGPSSEEGPHAHHAHGDEGDQAPPKVEPGTTYTCPMHPEIESKTPGECPKCGMDLVPKKPAAKPEEKKPAAKPEEKKPAAKPQPSHGEHGGHQ